MMKERVMGEFTRMCRGGFTYTFLSVKTPELHGKSHLFSTGEGYIT